MMEKEIKKNDDIVVEIESLSAQGSGVAHYKGMAVFVAGAVPGDKLLVHIIKVKSSYAIGKILQVQTPSAYRIKSNCPVSASCGGCCFRYLDYNCEKEEKRKRVENALRRIGGLDISVKEIFTPGSTDRYRNKGQYPIGLDKDGRTQIGFYAKKSHRIVECTDCKLQPKEFEPLLKTVSRWAAESGVSIYDEDTGKGLLRHIYIRKAHVTGETMVCLVVTSEKVPKKERLIAALRETDSSVCSVVLNINGERTNVILSEKCITIFGSDYIEDELCGLKFRISPLSFYQVNSSGAEFLYRKAKEFAKPQGKILLDLYCGTGTIGLSMAGQAKQLIGVEIIPDAVENARQNAKLNAIENADFICADASAASVDLANRGLHPDVILLDPPRKGVDEKVIEAVRTMAPKTVVYISCDCATLARDCKEFAQIGYKAETAVAVDMFPRTGHVETVVQLVRKTPDTYVDFEMNLDELDLTKSEMKSTYDDIKKYVLDKFGLKVSTLYISQVKRKLGLEVGESYNKSKADEGKVPKCPKDKEDAIVDALKYFRMV